VHVGDELMLRGPRNHFRFVDAPTAIIIAGGIGITPLIPMIRHCSDVKSRDIVNRCPGTFPA
jgi:ferredoxin-NADP reductase